MCRTLSLASCVQGINANLRKHESHTPNPAWSVKERSVKESDLAGVKESDLAGEPSRAA